MQAYDLRRGHFKNIEGRQLKALVEEHFGKAEEHEGKITASFGAITSLTVWTDGKTLFVDSQMNPAVADDVAVSTRKAWNAFLESATGFDAGERSKRLQKKAKEGKL
jgi:hypothetical protein